MKLSIMDSKELCRKRLELLDNLCYNFRIFQEISTKITKLVLRVFMLEPWTSLREAISIKKSSTVALSQWLN